MEAWLQTRPREVSVAFAARAALRVLPIVARDGRLKGDVFADLVLPVFGATSVAWTAAKYPAQATELEAAATRAFVAASSAAANIVDFNARHTADSAAEAANSAVQAYTAAEAAGAAAEAAYYAALAVDAVFWCAVSLDATVVEEGATASVIAGSPLWPQGQPDQLRSLWQEMKAALLAAKQDWNVWTDWYEARLRGDPAIKEFEIARAKIPDEIWNQGPAKVNAEIRLVEAHEPPQHGVVEL